MYRLLGKGVTTDRQLEFVGRRLFGVNWLGVFPSDVKPRELLKHVDVDGSYYGIINVDGRSDPGSHWLAIILQKIEGSMFYHIYDSYARKSKRLIPKFIKTIGYKYIDLNGESDQTKKETNCGARSMAVLLFVARHGLKAAKHI